MPQYDYRNEQGEVITLTMSIHDDIPAEVRSADLVYRRVFHPTRVVYNAMGFYTTDSASSIEQWRRENMKGL